MIVDFDFQSTLQCMHWNAIIIVTIQDWFVSFYGFHPIKCGIDDKGLICALG